MFHVLRVNITQEPLIIDPRAYKERGIRDRCLLFVTYLYVSKLQPRRLAEVTTPKLSAGPRRRRPLSDLWDPPKAPWRAHAHSVPFMDSMGGIF